MTTDNALSVPKSEIADVYPHDLPFQHFLESGNPTMRRGRPPKPKDPPTESDNPTIPQDSPLKGENPTIPCRGATIPPYLKILLSKARIQLYLAGDGLTIILQPTATEL
ncbi:hypothetical protein V8E54_005675 [Elaphomyces granulatus]